ncbi:MAG: hypothetical protein LBO78_02190 [Rickettsiales bacterium]|jgi:hypothetical protein|nr:hypothetical protein [Rickettsiales bacterium]
MANTKGFIMAIGDLFGNFMSKMGNGLTGIGGKLKDAFKYHLEDISGMLQKALPYLVVGGLAFATIATGGVLGASLGSVEMYLIYQLVKADNDMVMKDSGLDKLGMNQLWAQTWGWEKAEDAEYLKQEILRLNKEQAAINGAKYGTNMDAIAKTLKFSKYGWK